MSHLRTNRWLATILLATATNLGAAACDGDLNGDGEVNANDLATVLSQWGRCVKCEADLDGDGRVDANDLTSLLAGWGACPPSLGAVTPAWGPLAGGTTITVTGERLAGVTGLTVGGLPATGVTAVNPTTVTAVTPAGTEGPADVTVIGPNGSATLEGGFAYLAVTVPDWAIAIEPLPDPAVVADAKLRDAIVATGFAWRVRHVQTQIEMLLVPPGAFVMGCSASNQYPCSSVENPVHAVTLTNAFYLGRHEVTQAQWTAVMGSNPSHFQAASAQVAAAEVPSRPVERVSWNMAASFGSATGLRLPTEAEWEYACRAGTSTAFHSFAGHPYGTDDDTLLGNIAWAWTGNCSAGAMCQPRPVGRKQGNGLGFHDMSGNVWEWVNDWYLGTYYQSSPPTDPPGPSSGLSRALRGGAWSTFSYYLRSSGRGSLTPGTMNSEVGFRLAKTP